MVANLPKELYPDLRRLFRVTVREVLLSVFLVLSVLPLIDSPRFDSISLLDTIVDGFDNWQVVIVLGVTYVGLFAVGWLCKFLVTAIVYRLQLPIVFAPHFDRFTGWSSSDYFLGTRLFFADMHDEGRYSSEGICLNAYESLYEVEIGTSTNENQVSYETAAQQMINVVKENGAPKYEWYAYVGQLFEDLWVVSMFLAIVHLVFVGSTLLGLATFVPLLTNTLLLITFALLSLLWYYLSRAFRARGVARVVERFSVLFGPDHE